MEFNITIDTIMFVLAVLGCIALVFLIILLKRLASLFENINTIVVQNSTNVGASMAKIPGLIDNANEIANNAKEVSDLAAGVAEDIQSAKETAKKAVVSAIRKK